MSHERVFHRSVFLAADHIELEHRLTFELRSIIPEPPNPRPATILTRLVPAGRNRA
ncbi:MAG: hypothetical protein IID39_00990 [Planctomycetes bacterium]|nr:hypothetical protein [Planctomycetota bacterium]